jgi:GNAT superfamily N-acetyltransferase
VIRPATVDDAAAIARVHVETWRAAYAGLLPDAGLAAMSVHAGASRWQGHLADPVVRAWVAEEGGEVVAFTSGGPPRDADLAPEAFGEVYAVYVHPRAQRTGLGGGLLDAVCQWFGGTGLTGAALWVLTGNEAGRAFYERCGWVGDGSERGIDVGGAVVDEVRYTRNLAGVRALS